MYTVLKIYNDIMQDSRLKSLEEKIIINHIFGFQAAQKCCFSSNSFISSITCLSTGEVQEILQDLKSRKIIRIKFAGGTNTRMLSVIVPGQEEVECAVDDIFEY